MSKAPLRTGLCFGLAAVVFAATAGAGAPAGVPPKPAHGAKPAGSSTPSATPSASVAPSTSSAPGASAAATAAPADDAAAWFAKGAAAQEAGRSAEAEEMFLKVWAVKKAWDVAANLGLAQVNLGKNVDAAEHLAYALRWFPASEPVATKAVLERRLATARAEIGAVKVTVNIDGAQVRVNGVAKGASPLEGDLFVAPGSVTIEVEKDGYEAVRKTVDVAKGGSAEAALTLLPKTAPERSKVPAYVIGGVGIASLIAGAVLIGVAEGEHARLRTDAPRGPDGALLCWRTPTAGSATKAECDAWRASTATANTEANAAIGLFVVGGAALAGAAAYWFWPASRQAGTARRSIVVPLVSASGGGAMWTGNF